MNPQPGEVFVTRGNGLASRLIRLGAALQDKPNLDNHVAVMHHVDSKGIPWGIEGRPGGVGWVDMRHYLSSKWTVSNYAQQLGDAGSVAATTVQHALGTPYDWMSIAGDVVADLGLPDLFAADWDGKGVPGHVVCSSLAAWAYKQAGLPHPTVDGHERGVQPCDWAQFILAAAWEVEPK